MLSLTARRAYRSAAVLSLVLFAILIARPHLGAIPESLLPAFRLLFYASVVGTALTLIAMEYFLFGFDNSSSWRKVFWFCVLLLPPLGPPLYCFMVYSRSDVVKRFGTEGNTL